MQTIRPQLTKRIDKHVRGRDVWRAPAYGVHTYRELVEEVAGLSYVNRNHLLFFRGQDKDYQSKAGGSTLYPAIYRGDNLPEVELEFRFGQLDSAAETLVNLFQKRKIDGARDVARKRYIQWSILQHYEVVATPLLDLTHSLRVACSFAQLASTDPTCHVYVLALPYTMNRVSINSEEDIVNIRLLSICPPSALRPYFQEGYMAGTSDITSRYDTKTELDFRNRLIAKFAIPRAKLFWSSGFDAMPKTALYPSGDVVKELCDEIPRSFPAQKQTTTELGQFLLEWARLEERLLSRARQLTERNVSVREGINALAQRGYITKDLASTLDSIRRVRNMAAHSPGQVNPQEVAKALSALRELSGQIQRDVG